METKNRGPFTAENQPEMHFSEGDSELIRGRQPAFIRSACACKNCVISSNCRTYRYRKSTGQVAETTRHTMSNYQMRGATGGFFARGESVQWSDSLACDSLATELESMSMADPVSQWNARAGPQSSPQATGTGGVNSGSLLDSSGPFNDMNPFTDSRGSDEQAGVSAYASDMLSGTGTLDMLVSGSGRGQGHSSGSPRLLNPSQLGPIRDGSDSRSSSRDISRSISREMPAGLASISDGQVPVGGSRQSRDKQSLQQQQRGQGYRKLWQQVTKVGRGQKLGESLAPEVTVRSTGILAMHARLLFPRQPSHVCMRLDFCFLVNPPMCMHPRLRTWCEP